MVVATQVNDPVCQPDQQTPADNVPDSYRNQVISDEVHNGQVRETFRSRTDGGQNSGLAKLRITIPIGIINMLAMLCSKPLATNIATGRTMIIALSIRLRPE